MDTGIVINNLSKKYSGSDNFALKGITLEVKPGEVYGFLGPNGAGKSTTIRILMNFIQPTSGYAKINNLDVVADSVQIKKFVGYLSGDFAVYPKMSGKAYLEYMGELLTPSSKKYTEELISRFKAEPNKKLGELSRGNRQKFGIIQAFMHKPDIVILDEPTSGLDPLMQEEFYSLIEETKSRGAAIFMSSHVLGEVQKICDRVGIIREGKIVDELKIADMVSEASQTLDIVFSGKVPLAELKKLNGISVQKSDEHCVTLHIHSKLSPLFAVLAKHDVVKIDSRTLDLEDLFLTFYEDKK